MAYIGPAPKFGQHQKQVITGDSSTVTFTLDYYVTSENNIMVIYNGVIQEPGAGKAYTTSGNSITFSVAPTTGSTCWIIFLGQLYDVGTVADNAIVAAKIAAGAVTKAKLGTDALWQTTGATALYTGSPTSVTILSGLSNVDEINVMIDDFSTNTDNTAGLFQLGDAGGIEATGYVGSVSTNNSLVHVSANHSTGFYTSEDSLQDSANTTDISANFRHMGSNIWTYECIWSNVGNNSVAIGAKILSGELDRLQITTAAGTATFDNGVAYIRYK